MTNDRETLRRTFDEEAEQYERARPGYPDELFDDFEKLAALSSGARIVEVGCGTGKATRQLARRGYRILCVELGESLAAVARRELAQFPEVRVVTDAFESWNAGTATFDAVFAATAWHWVDPAVRYERAASVLEPNGVLSLVTTRHVFPRDADPFFSEIQTTYESIGEARIDVLPEPDDVQDLRNEIEASGLFGDVHVRRYVWLREYDADAYIDVLETYSGHRVIEPKQRERLYEDIRRRLSERPNGRLRKHYLNILHVAHRL